MASSGLGASAVEREPTHLYQALIPPAVLLDGYGRRHGIIPDAAIDVAMPAAVTQRHAIIPTAPQPRRKLLFDFKTTHHGGTTWYGSARGREDQSGAVAARAARVHSEYVRHARRLDQAHHPGTHPIQDRLEQFGQTRAAVIGSYSECSPDVHSLAVASARAWAARNWQEYGSRSEAECYSFIITAYRRQIGVYAAREMARHRLVRIPYIGIPHAALGRRTRRGDPGLGGGGYREHAIGAEAADLARHQALVGRYGLNFQAA